MSDPTKPPIPDAELDRLARQWFAEAHAQDPDAPGKTARANAAGDMAFDALSDLLEGDGGGDDSGD